MNRERYKAQLEAHRDKEFARVEPLIRQAHNFTIGIEHPETTNECKANCSEKLGDVFDEMGKIRQLQYEPEYRTEIKGNILYRYEDDELVMMELLK